MKIFEDSFQHKLIYVFEIRDAAHKGLLKIGDTTVNTDRNINDLVPNCKVLNQHLSYCITLYRHLQAQQVQFVQKYF